MISISTPISPATITIIGGDAPEVITLAATPVVEITMSVVGPQGPSGGAPVDLPLTVNTNGQTEFSVFSLPPQSLLIINSAEYHQTTHYTLGMVGPNATLTWLNVGFTLNTTDEIIFRKY